MFFGGILGFEGVIMASEVGALPVDPANVKAKGRLQPGQMFLVDFEQGRLIPDEELKQTFANQHPYGQWLTEQRIELSDLHCENEPHGFEPEKPTNTYVGLQIIKKCPTSGRNR